MTLHAAAAPALLFDLDGTLIHSMPLHHASWRQWHAFLGVALGLVSFVILATGLTWSQYAGGQVKAARDAAGQEIARGLANYSAAEARLIARRASSQIEALLGYANEPEMIHRDNLVLA